MLALSAQRMQSRFVFTQRLGRMPKCRIHNYKEHVVQASIEPWAQLFDIPANGHLNISYADDERAEFHIRLDPDGSLWIWLTADDTVISSSSGQSIRADFFNPAIHELEP
jgi:predicted nucleic-acid-binding Zn-ribbon protein